MQTTSAARLPRIMHRSAGAVVIDQGRCLALRHGRDWVFPKGHVERGEPAEEAARREVLEETGLDVTIVGFLGTTMYEFRSPDGMENRKRVDWYLARPTGGALRLEPRFRAYAYLTQAEAEKRLTFRDDRELVGRAFELHLHRP